MSSKGMSDLLENKDNEEEFLKQVGVMISFSVILQKIYIYIYIRGEGLRGEVAGVKFLVPTPICSFGERKDTHLCHVPLPLTYRNRSGPRTRDQFSYTRGCLLLSRNYINKFLLDKTVTIACQRASDKYVCIATTFQNRNSAELEGGGRLTNTDCCNYHF